MCEAVMVNTAGGIVGGDSARLTFEAGEGAHVALTSQSAEKIYRSDGARARMDVSLRLAAGARLEWLPQEAILFDRAAFTRSLAVNMAADARLVLCESVVFGRLAMGEQCREGAFRDRWRIRRAGRLVFAEDMRLEGAPADLLDRPAVGGGARALATLLVVAPDAAGWLEACRATPVDPDCELSASAFDGMLVARMATPSPDRLRTAILDLHTRLLGRAAPRVWR
ncbi:MAG: urease accessory protein UreD [Beijerinckiaceae bacterium]